MYKYKHKPNTYRAHVSLAIGANGEALVLVERARNDVLAIGTAEAIVVILQALHNLKIIE